MKVESTIDVYEYDGSEPEKSKVLKIHAHWNFHDRVVIEIGGHKYTVIARDLRMAIQNAENHE